MVDISIVNGVYKPTYNWGGTTLNHFIWYFMGITQVAMGQNWLLKMDG